MAIMGAGMHDGRIFPRMCLACHLRFIWQACFLFQWQSVHIGAQHHRWAIAIFHDCDNAVTSDIFADFALIFHDLLFHPVIAETLGHIETKIFEFFGEARSRILFFEGQLRIFVEMFIEVENIIIIICDTAREVIGGYIRRAGSR